MKLRTLLPAIIGLFALTAIVIAYQAGRSVVIEQVHAELEEGIRQRITLLQGLAERLSQRSSLQQIVSNFGAEPGVLALVIVDREQKVRASSRFSEIERPWQALGYRLNPEALAAAHRRRGSEVYRWHEEPWIDGYASICGNGESTLLQGAQCGFLFYRLNLGWHERQAISLLSDQALLSSGGILLAMLLVWLLLHGLVNRRASRLTDVLAAYGTGQPIRSGFQGGDELAQIGRSVDQLLDRLEEDQSLLRNSEQRMRAVLKSAADGIITIDADGTVDSINPEVTRIFGYRPEEVVGNNIRMLMPEPYHSQHDGYLHRYLQGGKARIIGNRREVKGLRKDGESFPLELAVSEMQVDGLRMFTGMVRDISSRKQAEAEQLLARRVFESADEAIVITDNQSRILDVNPSYLRITGFAREDVIGANPNISKSGRHDDDFYQQMWNQLRETGSWKGEMWDRRKDGRVYPKWLSINAIRTAEGEITHYVGIFNDISSQKSTEERLERLAYNDPLTGLANRALFKDRLARAIQRDGRSGHRTAVLFIDLDRFKQVNDTLGHNVGDRLLIEVAERIKRCVRESDTVARLGGDEFTVILSHVEEPTHAGKIAKKIIDTIEQPVHLSNQALFVGASIGISLYPDDGERGDALLKHADVAMYEAKKQGRGRAQFFAPQMNESNQRRMELEHKLRQALERDELRLFYQPKLDLAKNRICGMEALVRWQDGEQGLIPPDQFIPLAEETGLIVPIGEWVIETACRQALAWPTEAAPLQMAINLSARQFREPNLFDRLAQIIERTGIHPEQLELEITESMVMGNLEEAIAIMNSLRDMGVSLSMDDFGTGHSSLAYLKRFPITALKIDRSFIRDLLVDPADADITQAIISLGRTLGLTIIAEGVESAEQLEYLRHHGCHQIQGYYLARPLPAEALLPLLLKPPTWIKEAP